MFHDKNKEQSGTLTVAYGIDRQRVAHMDG